MKGAARQRTMRQFRVSAGLAGRARLPRSLTGAAGQRRVTPGNQRLVFQPGGPAGPYAGVSPILPLMPVTTFDAIIIGSGQAGNPLATALADAGRRVALI